ncbi:MAG: hypothetical protein QOF26_2292 [Baekduia sp.]|nr:hypothetical protein [Baekduia sp.]
MTPRRAAVAVLACLAIGGALALADQGGTPPAPTAAAAWTTRPEVPGAATTLVPFGMEATDAGSRAWALGTEGNATVVLRRGVGGDGSDGGWGPVGVPLAGLAPVGGSAPQHAAELSDDGHGALLAVARSTPGAEASLYTRAPGAGFVAAPAPGAALEPGEHLVTDAAAVTARALLAVVGGDATTAATFVVPTRDDGTATAVLRLDADGTWMREALVAPGPDALHPIGLAAASPQQAWLLARSGTTPDGGSDRLVLLHRVAGAVAHWEPIAADGGALLSASAGAAPALPAGVDAVRAADAPADPLTATLDGLWIDLRVTARGAQADVTQHLRVTPPAGGTTPSSPAPSSTDPSATSPSSPAPSSTAPSGTTPTSATPTSSAPTSTVPAGTPGAPTVTLDGRWCDVRTTAAAPLCDHPLGFAMADDRRGYRSVASPKTDDLPYGRRFVSAPLDPDMAAGAPRSAAERQGGFAALTGDHFVLADGIGEDGTSTTQAIAFDATGTGLTGGTRAFGATSLAAPPVRIAPPMPPPYDSIVAAAPSPSGDGRVLAIGRFGFQMLFTPATGWVTPRTLGLSFSRDGISIRALAWPRRDLVIGAGSGGTLSVLRTEPVPIDSFFSGIDENAASPGPPLPRTATFLDVACTAADPLVCVAVGLDGLVVRGDGSTWSVERLPGDGAHADITGVAFAGQTALLATSKGLYTEQDGDWRADPTITSPVSTVAGLPDGGAAVDGRWERDSAGAPWHRTSAPLDWHPLAIAAIRSGGHVRTLLSATADPVPLPPALPLNGPDRPDQLPGDPPPSGSVVLRETDDGWVDLDRSSFEPSGGRDLPASTPNTRVFAVDASGTGLALGGPASVQNGEQPGAVNPLPTVGWLKDGAPASFPGPAAVASQPPPAGAETPVPAGSVRLAIGGHPACLDRCSGASGQGVTPDVHLQAMLDRVAALRAGGAAPGALVVGGGRASVGGEALDLPGARRYRRLLDAAEVPTYTLPGPGDLPGGGADAFGTAFATWPAPEGSGSAPDGIDATAPQPSAADPSRARSAFAFDVRAEAGTVRVLAIDNAAGTLDPAQTAWIDDLLNRSREQGIPVVAVGSRALDDTAGATPATDAEEEIALLSGRASAYVATAGADDPGRPDFGGAVAQSTAGDLPLLQSATLGYGPTTAAFGDPSTPGPPGRFSGLSGAALLVLDVAVGGREQGSGPAPVTAHAEPLISTLQLDWLPSVPRSQALVISGTGTDPAQDRFLWPGRDGTPEPASSYTVPNLPNPSCTYSDRGCDSTVPIDATFSSSDPSVGLFVATDLVDRRPVVRTGADGNPVPDDHSPVFCPLTDGTTTLSIRVDGRAVSETVTVVEPPDPSQIGGSPRDGRTIEINAVPGTCTFELFRRVTAAPDTAAATPPVDPTPAPPSPAPAPAPHTPAPVVHHPQPAPHVPAVPAAAGPVVPAPPAPVAQPTPDASGPLVSPAAKPAAPAPPVPPHGVAAQQVQAPAPSPQVQIQQAFQRAEQRREREAFQSDQAAAAYEHPAPRLPWETIGVASLLLAAGAGGVAGRARRRRVVPAYDQQR